MIHKLKTLPAHFQVVVCGDKKAEIRHNGNRGFQKGDTVILEEWEPGDGVVAAHYTGQAQMVGITYVTNFKQKPSFVVFSFSLIGDVLDRTEVE